MQQRPTESYWNNVDEGVAADDDGGGDALAKFYWCSMSLFPICWF